MLAISTHSLTKCLVFYLYLKEMPNPKKPSENDLSKGKMFTRSSKGELIFVYLPEMFKLLECKTVEHANELLLKTPQKAQNCN